MDRCYLCEGPRHRSHLLCCFHRCFCHFFFFFSSRRRHTRSLCDWSDVCSSDLSAFCSNDAGIPLRSCRTSLTTVPEFATRSCSLLCAEIVAAVTAMPDPPSFVTP